MNKAKSVLGVLTAAKWLLENIGWTKNHYETEDAEGNFTAFCSSGALQRVEVVDEDLRERAYHYLTEEMNSNVIQFNDDPRNTKAQILSAFDRAIKRAKRQSDETSKE
jgi:hypothetical protein